MPKRINTVQMQMDGKGRIVLPSENSQYGVQSEARRINRTMLCDLVMIAQKLTARGRATKDFTQSNRRAVTALLETRFTRRLRFYESSIDGLERFPGVFEVLFRRETLAKQLVKTRGRSVAVIGN